MKIRLEGLSKDEIHEVSRIPCIGEDVVHSYNDPVYRVVEVIHILDANPKSQVVAIVRVKRSYVMLDEDLIRYGIS
jgi:hypothetical protein